MKKLLKWALIIPGALVIIIAVLFLTKPKNSSTPPVITAHFVDLDKVERISKFRSCQGHTVVPQNSEENKRSMKHYLVLKPEYRGGGKVSVYSPIDGRVKGMYIAEEEGLEGEIWLGSSSSNWDVSIQHLILADNIKRWQKVKAGDRLGYVADRGVDLVYAIGALRAVETEAGWMSPYKALDSVFNHMSDQVLADYQAKEISQENMIYAKEYRDQNPCQYRQNSSDKAGLNDIAHPEDWVKVK